MEQSAGAGKLFLIGGENVRFLIEEPVRMALEGLNVINLDHDSDYAAVIDETVDLLTPVCLVAGVDSLPENIWGWISKNRNRFPWMPIVILDHSNSRFKHEFLPQLVDSVAVLGHPYTQRAVIEAIEKSIWWSKNLCRMLERVGHFSNLSERELAIVSMATDGVPNKSMARRLEVSIKTIEKNRRTAYEKLKISSSAEMAALVTFRRYFNRSVEPQRFSSPAYPVPNISVPSSMPVRIVE